jgi:hypothetical protein
MDQGSSGSVTPALRPSFLRTASHKMHIFTLLELLNGVRWLAGGLIAQVTWVLEA